MDHLLLSPYQIKDVTLKNRIVMSPMCMYCVESEDGYSTSFHEIHYAARAIGQVGLVMIEATAVVPEGRISAKDIGIWEDGQVENLKRLVNLVHENGSKIAIQLAHAGRKAELATAPLAPSPLAFDGTYQQPQEMSLTDIEHVIKAFGQAARRAKAAGFDVVEVHAAHGYLLNQFLSPLTNQRTDEYGGTKENRFRIVCEVIEEVKNEWTGPLLVRISAEDYQAGGYTVDDYVDYGNWLKELGVDLIDVSTGGVVPEPPKEIYPGYQVPHAAKIRQECEIPIGAVGLITSGKQAEEILQNEAADLIFVGRELLRNPHFAIAASRELGIKPQEPKQYVRAF